MLGDPTGTGLCPPDPPRPRGPPPPDGRPTAMSTKKITAKAPSTEPGDGGTGPGDASGADPPAASGRSGRPHLLSHIRWSDATHAAGRQDGRARVPTNGPVVAETTIVPSGAVAAGRSRPGATLARVVRRIPFTTAVALVILAVGTATGSLWTPISERPWFPDVAYGLPSLTDGAWWTVPTGSLLALSPVIYVAVIASFLLFVGYAEWRLG